MAKEAKALNNTVLKGIMGDALVLRGECLNIDDDLRVGIYITHPSTKGTFPPVMGIQGKYGILIVLPKRNDSIYQMLIGEDGTFATRTKYNGSWQPWREPALRPTS